MRALLAFILAAICLLFAPTTLASEGGEANPAHPSPTPAAAEAREKQSEPKPMGAKESVSEPAKDPTKESAAHDVHAPVSAATTAQETDAKMALERLMDGNQRFVDTNAQHPRADQDRRCLTSSGGQHPYATILSCADSRVPPEILFDAGIGDLFVIRVAGNVADTDEIASIEYGSEHLGSNLIVVMGHTKCGAVTAVVNGTEVHGNLAGLLDNVKPAVDAAKASHPELTGPALVPYAVRANVMQSMADLLSHSPTVHELVASGKVKVVGAVYDIHSGSVQFLGEHPDQAALLKQEATETNVAEARHEETQPDAHAKETAKDETKAAKGDKGRKSMEEASAQHEARTDATKPESLKAKTDPASGSSSSSTSKVGPMIAFGVGSAALTGVIVFMFKR